MYSLLSWRFLIQYFFVVSNRWLIFVYNTVLSVFYVIKITRSNILRLRKPSKIPKLIKKKSNPFTYNMQYQTVKVKPMTIV